jgi:hypothetical protein
MSGTGAGRGWTEGGGWFEEMLGREMMMLDSDEEAEEEGEGEKV